MKVQSNINEWHPRTWRNGKRNVAALTKYVFFEIIITRTVMNDAAQILFIGYHKTFHQVGISCDKNMIKIF